MQYECWTVGYLLGCVGLLLLTTGCPGAMAPPARHTSLHGAKPVPKKRVELQASGGGHIAHAIYPGVGGVTGSLDLRTSLSDAVGLQLGGSAFRLFETDTSGAPWRGYLFSGRGGVEFHPTPSSPLALEAGVGGGRSMAGTFVSPDLGLVVSTDVKIFELVFGISSYGSLPIERRAVESPPIQNADRGGFHGGAFLPDRPNGGAGAIGRIGINGRIIQPTEDNPGLVLRSALGTTSGVDFEGPGERDNSFVYRMDIWLGIGVAVEL